MFWLFFLFKIESIRKKYRPNFDHIIIDCSPINYMDMMGIKTLIQIFKDYKEIGVTVLLCQVRRKLKKLEKKILKFVMLFLFKRWFINN